MGRTRVWLGVGAILAVQTGCPEQEGFGEGDDDTGPGDDDVVGDDDEGDDDTGSQDDDDSTDDDDSAAQGTTEGLVTLIYYEHPGHDWSLQRHISLGATFWTVREYPWDGVEFAEPVGPDSCALTEFTAADLAGATAGDWDLLDAGTLTLEAPVGDYPMEPEFMEEYRLCYGVELDVEQPGLLDAVYGLEASGAEFPAFSMSGEVPAAVDLISPPLLEHFPVEGALTVSWDGPDGDELWLELSDGDWQTDPNVQLVCRVHNDGEFVVPAETVELFPAGDVFLSLYRNVVTVGDADGLPVDFLTASGVVAIGQR
jgi:hypothetical protein